MSKLYGNVYWVSAFAKAYYYGNSVTDGIFVSKELWDKIDNESTCSVWYHGLDGKHSEVGAEVSEELITEDNAHKVFLEYDNSGNDEYKITEIYLGGQDIDLVQEIEDFHENFVEKLTFCTKVVVKVDDEIILVSE